METQKKLNLAMFSDSFFPVWGGRERVIHECMKRYIKNANAELFCPKIKGHIDGLSDSELPYKVVRCNSLQVGRSEYLAIANTKFKKEIENFKPDIIHCQTKYGLLNYAFKYRKKYHVPVVTTIHTNYPLAYSCLKFKPLIDYAVKRVVKLLNKCDGITAVSNRSKKMMEDCGVTVPITVIRNGVDMKNFNFDETTKQTVKEKLNISPKKFVIMFCGRLHEIKNILFQLEVVKELKRHTNDFVFLLVGEGSQRNELEQFVKSNNLQENVVFTGFVSDQKTLYSYYHATDLFFFASTTDSDGLVVVEAALNKTPSLVLEGMAACERIVDGYNGYISPNFSKECCKKLLKIMHNKKTLEEISQRAFETIPKNWNDISEEYEQFYKKVMKIFAKNLG